MNLVKYVFGDQIEREEKWESIRRSVSRFTDNWLSVVGLLMVGSVFVVALLAPYIAPHPQDATGAVHFDRVAQPPSMEFPMGTDASGRDILTRVIFGARISLKLGVVVLSVAISLGTVIGSVAGYVGGRVDDVLMRITDVFLSVPSTLLALAVAAIVSPSLTNMMLAISFVWWTWYARLVRGEVMSVKEDQFIEASESLGASTTRIITKEILPNILSPLTVKATLDMGSVILVGAGLSYLGLGANPPTPSWGNMIAQGRVHVLQYWWIATFPGLAISYTVMGYNLLGDGLRDMFDVEVET